MGIESIDGVNIQPEIKRPPAEKKVPVVSGVKEIRGIKKEDLPRRKKNNMPKYDKNKRKVDIKI